MHARLQQATADADTSASVDSIIDDIMHDGPRSNYIERRLMDAARAGTDFVRLFFVGDGSSTTGMVADADAVAELSPDELSTCMAFPGRLRTGLTRRFGAETIRCEPHRLVVDGGGDGNRVRRIEYIEVVVWWSVAAAAAAEQRRRL